MLLRIWRIGLHQVEVEVLVHKRDAPLNLQPVLELNRNDHASFN